MPIYSIVPLSPPAQAGKNKVQQQPFQCLCAQLAALTCVPMKHDLPAARLVAQLVQCL